MTSQCNYTHLGLANRRCFIAGLACTATLPMAANAQLAGPPTAEDVIFMRMAIEEARLADFPFGAVIVRDGEILAEGWNEVTSSNDPTAHAEIVAIRQAAMARQQWRLDGYTLVVTLEPCTMCAGALVMARVSRLVFGAWEPKTGAVGSLWDVVRDRRLSPHVEVIGGVLEDEGADLLREFFARRREGDPDGPEANT